MEASPKSKVFFEEEVLSVHHWTEELFSFRTTRDPGFRFQSGQFVMIGLTMDGKPLSRAYSIASAAWDDELEFYSIKVEGGTFTSRLRSIRAGDRVLIGRKPTGTLVLAGLRPGRRLFLLSTGTGLAPFLSLVREPETYELFERVVVTHGTRDVADLSYGDLLRDDLPAHEFLGDLVRGRVTYYPHVTREPFEHMGRITDLIRSGRFFADVRCSDFDAAHDRVMICGAPGMLAEMRQLLLDAGFAEGSVSRPGDFVIERAFVES